MALIASTVFRFIKHALGDGDLSGDLGEITVSNQAGDWLYDANDWRFKTRTPFLADIVANQTYVDLPPEYGEMIGVPHATAPPIYRVNMVHMADIAELRGLPSTPAGLGFWAALAYAQDDNGELTARLEIWPPQSTSATGGLTINYKARWTAIVDENSIIAVPRHFEALYLQVARAFAQGYEDEDIAGMEERLAKIQEGPVWRAAEMRDQGEQTEYGQADPGPAAEDSDTMPDRDTYANATITFPA